jgi:hypothetical protein
VTSLSRYFDNPFLREVMFNHYFAAVQADKDEITKGQI